ncbi:MAG TPA: ATP-binding protein [Flavobacteriales bacterium]|nr:ATP-binding protein [Flavobacteriales bacterium]
MKNEKIQANAIDVTSEFNWLKQLLDERVQCEFGNKTNAGKNLFDLFPAPGLEKSTSPYAKFIRKNHIKPPERIALLLALAPYLYPQILDAFLIKNSDIGKPFTEFGGIESKNHKGFIPTGQTLLFLLAGNNIEQRFIYMRLLEADSILLREGYIFIEQTANEEPFLSGSLSPSRDLAELFTKGEPFKPSFNASFPAKLITSGMNWNDLVLDDLTKKQLRELTWWLAHNHTLMDTWNMKRKIKPGYRALFYGPPGTGKTLTATLLGKLHERDVYRIDLSKIVSKYIGETEKNLATVFERAEHKDWILFFDEADALFGKRTNVQSSNDRHANQEVSYLLQRIEDYNGMVILASNLKTNIDEAFLRRFQSLVYFPMPKKNERFALWKSTLPEQCSTNEEEIDKVAEKYEVAGGTIINVVQYCALKAIENGTQTITASDLAEGMGKELIKMGRTS